jgi:hypothetical protein
MRLRVFKLKEGRLEYLETREARESDVILEGATPREIESNQCEIVSITEMGAGGWSEKARESRTLERASLKSVAGPTKNELEAARIAIKQEQQNSLKESFKQEFLRRGMDEKAAEIAADIAVKGR